MQEASILVLEDERAIAEMIEIILRKEGINNITLCNTIEEAKDEMNTKTFDFYLLDIMLPDGSGLDIANSIREKSDAPIFYLTAKSSDADKLRGFMNGADDYITKPFSPSELVARVKAHLSRYERLATHQQTNHMMSIHGITIDTSARKVFVNGEEIAFTTKEFDLLVFFVRHPNQVLSKEQLYERNWGYESAADVSTVTVHIRKLREKIEREPAHPKFLETVWGAGYRFNV